MIHHKLFPLFGLLLLLGACGSEDTLKPSNADTYGFEIPESDNSAEATLRRSFQEKYGSYLLFNDTLSNGELLDLGYNITASTYAYVYTFNYLKTMDEKQQAVDFLTSRILPHLGSKLRPFSFLLCNSITRYTQDGTNYNLDWQTPYPQVVSGKRGIAISLSTIEGADEATLAAYAQTVLVDLLVSQVQAQAASTLEPFTSVSNRYYGVYMDNTPETEEANILLMYAAGFCGAHIAMWGGVYTGVYPDQNEDIQQYVELVVNNTADEVQQKFSAYPLILQKYQTMVNLLNQLGYVK